MERQGSRKGWTRIFGLGSRPGAKPARAGRRDGGADSSPQTLFRERRPMAATPSRHSGARYAACRCSSSRCTCWPREMGSMIVRSPSGGDRSCRDRPPSGGGAGADCRRARKSRRGVIRRLHNLSGC